MLEKIVLLYIIGTFTLVIVGSVYWIYKQVFIHKLGTKILFSFITSIVLIFSAYSCLVMDKHYSVDSFNLLYDMSPYWHIMIGRYTNAGMIFLFSKFGVNQVVMQQVFMLLWITTAAFSVTIISFAFYKNIFAQSGNIILITSIISLIYVNVFMMELMLFTEMAMVLFIGNIALAFSVYLAINRDISRQNCIGITVFLFIAIGNYQSYIGIFEILVLVAGFIKYRDHFKKRYLHALASLVIGGGVSILNIVIVKLLIKIGWIVDSGRGASFSISKIINNIVGVIKLQKNIWVNAQGLWVKYLMLLVILVCIIVLSIYIHKLKVLEQKIYFIVIIVGCYSLVFAAHFIEANTIFSPRSNVAFWSMISVISILGYKMFLDNRKKRYCMGLFSVYVIGLSILFSQNMATNVVRTNTYDLHEASLIVDKIKQYEKETNNQINKISYAKDENVKYYSPVTKYHVCEFGGRILATDYSAYRLIGHCLENRWIELEKMPEEVYNKFFTGKDWDTLCLEEQIFFDKNTMYWVVY